MLTLFRSLSMQPQIDAMLYLWAPAELAWCQLSPTLSSDPECVKMRLDRLAWAGMGPLAANTSTPV